MNYLRIVLAGLFVVLISCEQRSVDEGVIAEWRFVSIKDTAHTDMRQVGPEDLMRIRSDRTFTYKLALEDIMARGEWEVEGNKLIFIYDENEDGKPDYTRTYNIKELSDTTLIMEEKGVDYKFRKELE